LAQAVAVDPAMLLYLNNASNRVGAPNENWARECLELFTLGPGQYTQADVVAAARAWTGHNVRRPTGGGTMQTRYEFKATLHDNVNKTFLGITRNWDGPELLANVISGHKREAHARFLTSKLWSYFAYANPEPAVVDALATAYVKSNRSISSVMKALFMRPEFWSVRARRSIVRSPTELIVAAMRASALPAAAAEPQTWDTEMGQRLFFPPNVAGWGQNSYWLSTTAMRKRAEFAGHIATRALEAGTLPAVGAMHPEDAVQRMCAAFGIFDLHAGAKAHLESWLRAERSVDGEEEEIHLAQLVMLTPDFQLS
jgi:uncharacterized protein (DUF1800 family)